MKICNIKVSLHFEHPFFKKERSSKKTVTKLRNWTLIQYMHSPNLINLTGLKSREEVFEAIYVIEKEYQNKCINSQIDCCMISHKDNKCIHLFDVVNHLRNITNLYYVDFEPELFTGCFLKPYNRSYPTINLFYTASYQLFGGKSIEKIEEALKIVQELIQKCQDGMHTVEGSKEGYSSTRMCNML